MPIILDNQDLVVSFCTPTKQEQLPANLKKEGCIYSEENNIHCYHFPKEKIIGENNFSFPKDTYVYIGTDIYSRTKEIINEYADNGDIVEEDILLEKEYIDLIYCIYKSKFIKRGLKRKLEVILSNLCNKQE